MLKFHCILFWLGIPLIYDFCNFNCISVKFNLMADSVYCYGLTTVNYYYFENIIKFTKMVKKYYK